MNIFLNPHKEKSLIELLREKNIKVNAPCGGNGKCGKCKVKILSGETSPAPDEKGYVLACGTILLSCCEVYIPEEETESLYMLCDEKASYAICDIGTSMIKLRFYSKIGELVSVHKFPNPQSSFGADVISRISACGKGDFENLCFVLRNEIEKRVMGVDKVYICGNPAMIHFMAWVDPSSIGVYPFSCVFRNTKCISKKESGLSFDMVLLPSASGYVGSDAICGIYALLKHENAKNILIADLGTNGEITLIKNGKIYSATTAAGPAMEGAGIEMGLMGGDGVVYSVNENGEPIYQGEEPKGINGAGLISLISFLRRRELLSPEGKIEKNPYYLTEKLYVSRKDISKFMLAKSAIKTAIEILCRETDTEYDEIDKFILTGGVTSQIKKIDDIFVSGIISKELCKKVTVIPDLAIVGAHTAFSCGDIEVLEEISEKITVINLSENVEFEDCFVANTFFED